MNQRNALRFIQVAGIVALLFGCVHHAPIAPVVPCEDTKQLKAEIVNLNRGLQRLSKEAKAVEQERDVLAAKIQAYLALNCRCKHKAVLK
jgi:hypothetical protein